LEGLFQVTGGGGKKKKKHLKRGASEVVSKERNEGSGELKDFYTNAQTPSKKLKKGNKGGKVRLNRGS